MRNRNHNDGAVLYWKNDKEIFWKKMENGIGNHRIKMPKTCILVCYPYGRQDLKSILGDDAVDIQHIGSTAIPAIKAKPIIDIAVGVTDFEKIMSYNEQLQKDGIFYRGSDVENQILYVMGDMEKDIRTHHIHVVKWNGTEWRNYIHFRDCLNANENMALQYQRVKEELESKYADNRGLYTKGKKEIIDIILNN